MADTDSGPNCPECGYPLRTGEHAPGCSMISVGAETQQNPEEKARQRITSFVQEWVKLGIPERYKDRFESKSVISSRDINWGGNDEEKAIADKMRDVLTLVEGEQPLDRIVQLLNELITLVEKRKGEVTKDGLRVEIDVVTGEGLKVYKIG